MPKGGIKGNKGNSTIPKIESSDMAALLAADRAIIENDPNSPPVNKKNLRAMSDVTKAEAVADNLYMIANIIDGEINASRNQLKNSTAVDLDDTEAVMQRAKEYFVSCAAAKHPPSVMTFCSIGLGLTRNAVGNYCRKHSNGTTDFILRTFDLIADAISTGALYGNLDNIMAIFQLKNLHGFADNVRIEAATVDQNPSIDEEALAKEYEAYAKENGIEI